MNNYTYPPTLGDILRTYIAENGEAEKRPMTDTYTTKLDMQTGTINICGGDTRFQFVIDEVPEIIESLKSEYERAKAIMGNPLLDTRGVDEAMTIYNAISNSGEKAYSLQVMVEFYQNTLVMLRELHNSLHMTTDAIFADDAEDIFDNELLVLNNWRDKLAAILEAHKHNMPEE